MVPGQMAGLGLGYPSADQPIERQIVAPQYGTLSSASALT